VLDRVLAVLGVHSNADVALLDHGHGVAGLADVKDDLALADLRFTAPSAAPRGRGRQPVSSGHVTAGPPERGGFRSA
jgi:hypothetical protein